MKANLLLAMVACAALGACATSTASVTEGKTLADAWGALNGASVAADAAVKSGVLKGSEAATVSADLTKADQILTAATTAYQANQSDPSVATDVTDAAALVVEIVASVVPAK